MSNIWTKNSEMKKIQYFEGLKRLKRAKLDIVKV